MKAINSSWLNGIQSFASDALLQNFAMNLR